MITNLKISGFKRFTECSLEFAPLTILSGLNGAGKTTIIQSLLLARQASLPGATIVPLNGPFGLELGAAQDVLNLDTAMGASTIEFVVESDDGSVSSYHLDAGDDKLLHLPISHRPERVLGCLGGPHQSFTYLSAERLGPRDVLGASAGRTDDLGVGVRGEFCAQVLALNGLKKKTYQLRRHPERRDDADTFLKYQVEAWLSEIVRPTELDTIWFPNTSVTALRFRAPRGEWVRAPNMGFGVSYCLPIVLAGLIAPEKDAMLIVENPEAHLHPAGQSRIGVFLAVLASSGMQVLVETHSDHVLNGIRRAIGERKILDAKDALVHFFDADKNGLPSISTLRFNGLGGVSDWPSRFFDQYQIDVAAISRIRRGSSK